jgi:hypothetical protein
MFLKKEFPMPISLNIISWLEAHQLPCLIKAVFKINCPTCGIQRSIIALLQGKLADSFSYYPPLFFILFFFLLLFINKHVNFLAEKKFVQIGVPSVFIVILISYIYQNI